MQERTKPDYKSKAIDGATKDYGSSKRKGVSNAASRNERIESEVAV